MNQAIKRLEERKSGEVLMINVIDLFCGVGGLSHGMKRQGLNIVAGIDNDKSCAYGYEHNNARFICKDVLQVTPEEINELFGNDNSYKVLAGCAPCQPFSALTAGKDICESKLQPIQHFANLIDKVLPDIVVMENVRGCACMKRNPAFQMLEDMLEANGYRYKHEVVDFSDYGVPQSRQRLILLASRLGKIDLLKKTHESKKKTVRDVIGNLEPLTAGEASQYDLLHRARKLSRMNLKRISATPADGGSSLDWPQELLPDCYKKNTGKTYRKSAYARMWWDKPAPTLTRFCNSFPNGRFGHPAQDRGISLREAARLQTFPDSYQFSAPDELIAMARVAQFIGNAVPPLIGEVIGRSIKKHIKELKQGGTK